MQRERAGVAMQSLPPAASIPIPGPTTIHSFAPLSHAMDQAPGLGSVPRTKRRKAGQGLHKMPTTVDEWRMCVTKYNLSQRNLSDICQQGSFSASNVPVESLLTVRPVWPKQVSQDHTLKALVDAGTFFSQRQADDASYLLHACALGLDLICDKSPPSTPIRMMGSLGDHLGSFAQLVSLYNLLKQRVGDSLQQQQQPETPLRLLDAPKAPRFRHISPSGGQGAEEPESPTEDLIHRRANNPRADETPTTPIYPRICPSSPDGNGSGDDDDGPDEQAFVAADGARGAEGAADIALPPPTRRTPTETLVVDFLVTFAAAIATQVQPFGGRPVCVADAFERTFQFGPVSTNAQRPAAFCARVDGRYPFKSANRE
ncbi:hypothetical protein B0T24DRAFT_281593 [Lasiosphaeria ovina]|uniref:Uncharacterized protein n=1 Tax=Lasiosphaeria ovina TaxID=92902 RepID=A0AAE0N7S8_9PEZI|nr:hypothetical protein B0T24DRAFT_281593 [Lasiosphaeria ovina]